MSTTTTNYSLIKPGQEEFYNVDDFNHNADIIDAELKNQDEQIKVCNKDISMHENRITSLENSFVADIEAYYGNTKLIDDLQNKDDFAVILGTISEDTTNVKLGNKSMRLTNPNNLVGSPSMLLNNINLDLKKLNSGEISSDEDYIFFVVYVSDATKIGTAGIQIALSQEASFTTENIKYRSVTTGIVTGWNYFKLKKSLFVAQGAGAWDNIKSVRFLWNATENASGAYVSFQLAQLVKKDMLEDKPNPFQSNGVRDFTVNSGEWFVGEEFGKLAVKELSQQINVAALTHSKSYNDFIINGVKEITSWSDGYVTWYKDVDNYITVLHAGNSTGLVLRKVENGVSTVNDYYIEKQINIGDIIRYTLEKKGTYVSSKFYLNEVYVGELCFETVLDYGILAIGSIITGMSKVAEVSITELSNAHHANIADVAKSLAEQPKCRVKSLATQSIANAATTILLFDTVSFDNMSHFNLSDPTKITIKETGLYLINASVAFAHNTTGVRQLSIVVNTTTIAIAEGNTTSLSAPNRRCASTIYELKQGDTVTAAVYQNSGTSLDIHIGNDYSPALAIAKIG